MKLQKGHLTSISARGAAVLGVLAVAWCASVLPVSAGDPESQAPLEEDTWDTDGFCYSGVFWQSRL